MEHSVYRKSTTGCKLNLIVEAQPEGGFTITCRELPELITECDDLDQIKAVVIDALCAVIELYDYQKRSLPEEIQVLDNKKAMGAIDRHLLETVVPIHELSQSHSEVEESWL